MTEASNQGRWVSNYDVVTRNTSLIFDLCPVLVSFDKFWINEPIDKHIINVSYHLIVIVVELKKSPPQNTSRLHHLRSVMGTVTSDLSYVGSLIWSSGLNCCSHYLTTGQVECDRCGIIRNAHHCQHQWVGTGGQICRRRRTNHSARPPVSSSTASTAIDVNTTQQPEDTNCYGKDCGRGNGNSVRRFGFKCSYTGATK